MRDPLNRTDSIALILFCAGVDFDDSLRVMCRVGEWPTQGQYRTDLWHAKVRVLERALRVKGVQLTLEENPGARIDALEELLLAVNDAREEIIGVRAVPMEKATRIIVAAERVRAVSKGREDGERDA